MLNYIKKILRIASSEFDDEINQLIDACKKDLELSGVREEMIIDTDELIKRAISLYCKTHFGYDNKDYPHLSMAYDLLKAHMIVSIEYGKMD
jgi:predicted nucleic acid-binding protein